PIVWELESSATANGLRQYALRLRLVPQGLPAGPHEGPLCLRTTSTTRPTITIPVRFEVLAAVRAVPGVVSIGTARVGQPQRQELELVSDAGPIVAISAESLPPQCMVDLPEKPGGNRVAMTIRLARPGIWRQEVILSVRTERGAHRVVVPCVGLGTED
ncbi:MAG: hypothetical protein NUV77_24190, partial [Thermoguttaceae bacterium]|nr:hypothetical protein [Thermoguttaceae bacterium]